MILITSLFCMEKTVRDARRFARESAANGSIYAESDRMRQHAYGRRNSYVTDSGK